MRGLKFRAWDTEKDEWADFVDIRSDGSVTTSWGSDSLGRMIVEQSTGLHDVNGAEIYEGDIIKVSSRSYGVYAAAVEYSQRHAGWIVSLHKKQLTMPESDWTRKHDPCNCDGALYEGFTVLIVGLDGNPNEVPVEVIGNIHEHPVLLK